MNFRALQTFFAKETGSKYVEGLTYTARTGFLKAMVHQWRKQGKVEIVVGDGDKAPRVLRSAEVLIFGKARQG